MSFQETFPNGSRAMLRAAGAALLVEVLGFEFPDAVDDFNAPWLVARVTWSNAGGRLACEGPLFMIEELAAWGHAVIAHGEASFIEPNVRFACMSRDEDDNADDANANESASDARVVSLELLHEAKSGNVHLTTRLHVTSGELAAFGRALVEMARLIATRRLRPQPTRVPSTGSARAEVP